MIVCVFGSERIIECGNVGGGESISVFQRVEIAERLTQPDFTRPCFKMLHARALKHRN
jgi:hypothetical protein